MKQNNITLPSYDYTGNRSIDYRNLYNKSEPYNEWYNKVNEILLDLHKKRITVYGYEDVSSCYQVWYICLKTPSQRRSFGNLGGHGDWWPKEETIDNVL